MHRQQKISCKKVLYISHTPAHLTYPTLCCSDWVGGDAERWVGGKKLEASGDGETRRGAADHK